MMKLAVCNYMLGALFLWAVPMSGKRSLQTAVCPVGSKELVIDFDTLLPETFVSDQFLSDYGFEIVGKRRNEDGGLDSGNWARLYDSSVVPAPSNHRDLGSPNKNCPGCTHLVCPGFSRRNGPGFLIANVTNCVKQHNILIIHKGDMLAPATYNRLGGVFELIFTQPIRKLLSLGFMDVAEPGQVVKLIDTSSTVLSTTSFDGDGDNTVQELNFGSSEIANVKTVQIEVMGTMTKFAYCADTEPQTLSPDLGKSPKAPSPTTPPTKPSTPLPTKRPTPPPTKRPTPPPTKRPTPPPTKPPTERPTEAPMSKQVDIEIPPRDGSWVPATAGESAMFPSVTDPACTSKFRHCCVGQCRQLALVHPESDFMYEKWSPSLPQLVDLFRYMDNEGLPCHLAFIGDSLSHDHAVAGMCEFERLLGDYELKSCFPSIGVGTPWGEGDVTCDEKRHDYVHFEFDKKTAVGGSSQLSCNSLTISYGGFKEQSLQRFVDGDTSRGGVMVWNYGIACKDPTDSDDCMKSKLEKMKTTVRNETYSNWKMLWRETEPSHYNTHDGSWEGNVLEGGHKFDCKAVDNPSTWRNDMAANFIRQENLQLPIIPLTEAMNPAWWWHVLMKDCTHYCYTPWRFQLTWDGILRGLEALI